MRLMSHNSFGIDETERRVFERGHNGQPRTVASLPKGMTAEDARKALRSYNLDGDGHVVPVGGQDAAVMRREWVAAAFRCWGH